MKKLHLAISLICCFSSCAKDISENVLPDSKQRGYISISSELENKIEYILSEKHALMGGSVGGAMLLDIEKVNFDFQIKHAPMKIDEARLIYVDCIQEFLKFYNNNEQIRPYLANYPFTVSNISLNLNFLDENGSKIVDNSFVYFIFNKGDKIFYRGFSPNVEPFVKLHHETYEEALAKYLEHPISSFKTIKGGS
ncbi:MAG: Conserved hypothetical rane protein [Chlamydiales bacterium]|jgi:hypothetical protein|nr:Conserved hypothetical rane protein [Chlamydiales bacterium]